MKLYRLRKFGERISWREPVVVLGREDTWEKARFSLADLLTPQQV